MASVDWSKGGAVMSFTPFSDANSLFTQAAHKAAQSDVYAEFFPGATLTYERVTNVTTDARHKVLDGELGIDLIVSVDYGVVKPLRFTVQERFRKTQYQRFADLTITEWNHITNQPSELYKIASDLFVYGYYDPTKDAIVEAIVMYCGPLKKAIATGELPFQRGNNPRTDQSFITVPFADLHAKGLIKAHYKLNAQGMLPF
jgi:hypothetical protein